MKKALFIYFCQGEIVEISLFETYNNKSFIHDQFIRMFTMKSIFCNRFSSYFDNCREEIHLTEQKSMCLEVEM